MEQYNATAAHYFISAFSDLFSAKSLSGILNINIHIMKGFLEALKSFDPSRGMILTYDEFDRIDTDGRTIEVQPAWYWVPAR